MEGPSRGISHPAPALDRQSGPPATKRQKVAIACDVCRAKKVKVSMTYQRFGLSSDRFTVRWYATSMFTLCSKIRSRRALRIHLGGENQSWTFQRIRYVYQQREHRSICVECLCCLSADILLVHHLELKLRELQAEKGQSPGLLHQRSDPGTFPAINHARSLEQSWSPPGPQHSELIGSPSAQRNYSSQNLSNGSRSYNVPAQQKLPPQQPQNGPVLNQSVQRPLVFKSGQSRNIQPMHSEPDYDHSDFFGSKSAGSFVQQIRAAISAKGNTPSPGHNTPVTSGSPLPQLPTMQPKTHHGPTPEYVLPSRKAADTLLDVYWNAVHPLYPFLDRRQFQRMYEGIWAGEPSESDESLMTCTLNVVFALASQFSDSLAPKEREFSARKYFDRAQDLLNLDLWDIGSVQLVQCLLLMGQYLQSTNSPHQAWMVTGLTVRIAEGLGLHLPETSIRIDDVHQRELVRRLWHGCVVMDR